MFQEPLTTADVMRIFAEEIADRSGTVSDTFDDGRRLFARSLLPFVEEVRPKDRLQGGVAVRATRSDVWVHPYVFRQVCRNGAIMAQALQTLHLTELDCCVPEDALREIRRAVQACSERDCFVDSVEQMRSSVHDPANEAINMLAALSHLPRGISGPVVQQVLERYFRVEEPSRFGVVNAVTATARETRDPELRWRLEELGGGIAARILPHQPADESGAVAVRQEREVLTGV